MRRLLIILLMLIAATGISYSQTFPVDTLAKPGSLDKMINLVFIGDGYTEADLPTYSTDVNNFVNGIFAQTPFKEYKNYFNVFAIKVVSNQSGVSHPRNTSDSDCPGVPMTTVDNFFGTTFDTNGIHRLLAPQDYIKAFSVLNANLPSYDQIFIIANTPYYGGSGGTFATASTNTSANEVAVHEMGHSFAALSDEYWVGAGYAAETANMTKESDPAKVKWKNWLNKGSVGIYAYSEDPSWYRPHQNCKMRFLNVPFCNVCRETFVERIHNLVNPVLSYSPLTSTLPVETSDFEFTLTTVDPTPNTLRILWKKDDVVVAKNKNSFSVVASTIETTTSIKAEISDTTGLSKSPSHASSHVRVVSWTLQKGDVVTGFPIQSNEAHYKLSVSPNPTTERVNVSYLLSVDGVVKMQLRDINGRKLITLVNEKQNAGQYDYQFTTGDLNMHTAGIYLLSLTVNGTTLTERIIRD